MTENFPVMELTELEKLCFKCPLPDCDQSSSRCLWPKDKKDGNSAEVRRAYWTEYRKRGYVQEAARQYQRKYVASGRRKNWIENRNKGIVIPRKKFNSEEERLVFRRASQRAYYWRNREKSLEYSRRPEVRKKNVIRKQLERKLARESRVA